MVFVPVFASAASSLFSFNVSSAILPSHLDSFCRTSISPKVL